MNDSSPSNPPSPSSTAGTTILAVERFSTLDPRLRAFAIDLPASDSRSGGFLLAVAGWVVGASQPVDSVSFFSDGAETHATPVDLHRPDVQSHLSIGDERPTGFSTLINVITLPPEFTLIVAASCGGRSVPFARIRGTHSPLPETPVTPGETVEKILITSTPKTGNVWLESLLSAIYELPSRPLPLTFSAAAAAEGGRRWIAHAHYYPSRPLLDWAAQNQVVLVTTLRHPGDALVSLQKYVQAFADDPGLDRALAQALASGDDAEARLAEFVRRSYYCDLSISISWMRLGCSHLVRYEDLWRDPVTTLARLTSCIRAVPEERIQRAVDRCALEVMRSNAGKDRKFFRKGGVGDWQAGLPAAIHSILREQAPYPEQLAFLGYRMDAADPRTARPRLPRKSLNPFESITEFANGVPVPPIAAIVFLSFETDRTRHWLPAGRTGSGSFFEWLVSADESDGPADGPLRFTNLASYIYSRRWDLQQAIPDARGPHRVWFMQWFLASAAGEYELHDVFVDPIRRQFMAWANAPAADDPNPDSLPRVTNYLAYLYGERADVRRAYPDPWDGDRMAFVNWFLLSGRFEAPFGNDLAVEVARSWTGAQRDEA